jgi:hypothetical protein
MIDRSGALANAGRCNAGRTCAERAGSSSAFETTPQGRLKAALPA